MRVEKFKRRALTFALVDVDHDGPLDLICSGVWYRNPGKPREPEFERFVFDGNVAGAHDILVADINRAPDLKDEPVL